MQLPLTSNSLLFWLDPSEKFVALGPNNRITSIVDRLSGIPLFADNPVSFPVWSDNNINGRPALIFSGAQNLRFNFNYNAASVSIAKVPITLMMVVKTDTFTGGSGSTVLDLGSKTNANPGLILGTGISSGNKVRAYRFDDIGNSDFGTLIASDTNFHLYTIIYDGANIRLRIDGKQIDSVIASSSTGRFDGNQLSIGDYTQSSATAFGHTYAICKVATILMYVGLVGDVDLNPEDYLRQYYGI